MAVKKTSTKTQAKTAAGSRTATISRKTKETDITLTLNLDGTGKAQVDTGIGFFDHMLEGFAKHGFFDLQVKAKGDLQVDGHHTVEDVGICMGQAIAKAVGDKAGIRRYGYFILPMDDALMLASLDLCGRCFLGYECEMATDKVGEFETQLAREFFQAVADQAAMNLHIRQLAGINDHHKIEAMFKAFSKALDMAVSCDERVTGVLSTKGAL